MGQDELALLSAVQAWNGAGFLSCCETTQSQGPLNADNIFVLGPIHGCSKWDWQGKKEKPNLSGLQKCGAWKQSLIVSLCSAGSLYVPDKSASVWTHTVPGELSDNSPPQWPLADIQQSWGERTCSLNSVKIWWVASPIRRVQAS